MTTPPGFSLARRLRAGDIIYSGWCGLASPVVAEIIAREGFPATAFDQQHGLYDMATTAQGIVAVRLAGSAPVVRVPLGDFAVASRVLDLGAEAVIAPMINTPEDAHAFVAATKFPPLGERSWGPSRAMMLSGISDAKGYLRDANEMTMTFAMIETTLALKNVETIAATPGIDALFVGPSDLSITLSNGAELDPHSQTVEAALDKIVAAAKKFKKIAGLYSVNADRAIVCVNRGFTFFAIGSDTAFVRAGAAEQMKKLKDS
jgi:4-hydroxy-2-oxoheptanedioate aldolase